MAAGKKRPKGRAKKAGYKRVKRQPKDSERRKAFEKALVLEMEGYEFYSRGAERTNNPDGKTMFMFLADEEGAHYARVEEIFRRETQKTPCPRPKAGSSSGIFEKGVPGGNLDDKSDALAALNVGIRAEENSIRLYRRLSDGSKEDETKELFLRLVDEERKHKQILEAEVEFVTDTGEFHDFTAVTA